LAIFFALRRADYKIGLFALRSGERRLSGEKLLDRSITGFLATRGSRRQGRRQQAGGRALPETQTRERRRPELRVYFTGLRFGSIFVIPAPLFTSMI
jgi:hypothetical protein